MPSKYVSIQGVATFLRHTGSTTLPESPPLLSRGEIILCIHHAGGNSRNFDAVTTKLAEHHSPLAFDLPGHDRSGSQVGLGSVVAMAEFAACVLKALHVDRPVVVLGHGMGGNVALQMALEHRDCVRALVLANCAAAYSCGDELIERTRLVSTGRARREFDPKLFAKGCAQETLRTGFMDTLKTDPRVIYSNLLALRSWSGVARMDQIDVPSLICSGESDSPASLREAVHMAETIPGAAQKLIPNAAHMLPTEEPGVLNDAVCEFLGALS